MSKSFSMFVIETVNYQHHTAPPPTHTGVFRKPLFCSLTNSLFIWSKAKMRRPSLLVGTTQTLHTFAITIDEEKINFGCDSLWSGHGLFENNQGEGALQKCWPKKDTL